ncbi:MAG: amino acid ABC transporter substrate-binding protein [Xanthobacteraceae bacterium]|nr:amino acid ABC transporter substrate-binding protein [Xanthobacteraceae bacterium]
MSDDAKSPRSRVRFVLLAAMALFFTADAVRAAEPIRIGFAMALTGGLAGGGKSAVVAYKMWEEDVNARGGLLGRPVQLVYYDDQSNPANVPGIYTKLLDIDKVDLVISPYATSQQAAAMPVIVPRGLLFVSLFGTAVNAEYRYDRFFQMTPNGPDPKAATSTGFFEAAMAMNPQPKTVALVGADAEFSKNSLDGARLNAKKHGLKIVYDRTYPPNTVDFTPVMRSIQASGAELVFAASYPPDSVGLVRTARELKLSAAMFGGAMIGLQYAAIKQQLGSMLNGVTAYDYWVPEPTMNFPGIDSFLKRYQERASKEGVDPLGFFIPPFAYAQMQVIERTVTAVGSLDQKKLAEYAHNTEFSTIVGKVKFGADGEWDRPQVIYVQYRGISGNDLGQFKRAGTQIIVSPPQFKSGDLDYPFLKAR